MNKEMAVIQAHDPPNARNVSTTVFGNKYELTAKIFEHITNSYNCHKVAEWRVEFNQSGQGHYFAGVANRYHEAGMKTGGPIRPNESEK